MAKKSKYSDSGVDVFFVSNNENTLPTRDVIIGKIEDCIPSKYKIICHEAVYNRFFLEEVTIHYHVEQVDSNRYKINIRYVLDDGVLGYFLMVVGLVVGCAVGYGLFKEIGAFIGAIAGVFLFAPNALRKDAEDVCDRIVTEIKEYERAHLLSVSTR